MQDFLDFFEVKLDAKFYMQSRKEEEDKVKQEGRNRRGKKGKRGSEQQ